MTMYKIGEFAKMTNISKSTLQSWDRTGKLKAARTLTNRRFYTEEHLQQIRGDFFLIIEELTEEKIKEIFIKTYETTFQSRFDEEITEIEQIFYNKNTNQQDLPTKINNTRTLVNVTETTAQYKIKIKNDWYILQFKKSEYNDSYKDRLDINIIDLG